MSGDAHQAVAVAATSSSSGALSALRGVWSGPVGRRVRRGRGLLALAALLATAAACGSGTNAPAPPTAVPLSQEDSERQLCVSEHALIVWAGQRLEESAYLAIEQYNTGDTAAAQAAYDQTARVADGLPELAFRFGERCGEYAPGLVSGVDEAAQFASAQWRRLREGCEQGPALEGFNC